MPPITGFVHIVESPSSRDLLDGRTEGRSLSEALALSAIRYRYNLVTDLASLRHAIGERLFEAWRYHQAPPILHFSMHGDQEGVGLTCGDRLSWNQLRSLLLPLSQALRGGLLISMSSCFGLTGCRMAFSLDEPPAFWALVGNKKSPTWPDAAVAYITFYHLFFKGVDFETCVRVMNAASGDNNFAALAGRQVQDSWGSLIQQHIATLGPGIRQAADEVEKGTQPLSRNGAQD